MLSSNGTLGIGRVQLVEVDAIEAQTAQASLARLAQVLGPPVPRPGAGALAEEPALGGDHEALRVGVQRLGDQELAHLGAVGVGRVDQVHAQLDGAPQDAQRVLAVVGPAENPRPA